MPGCHQQVAVVDEGRDLLDDPFLGAVVEQAQLDAVGDLGEDQLVPLPS
jgi:hypothetical protein